MKTMYIEKTGKLYNIIMFKYNRYIYQCKFEMFLHQSLSCEWAVQATYYVYVLRTTTIFCLVLLYLCKGYFIQVWRILKSTISKSLPFKFVIKNLFLPARLHIKLLKSRLSWALFSRAFNWARLFIGYNLLPWMIFSTICFSSFLSQLLFQFFSNIFHHIWTNYVTKNGLFIKYIVP